MPRAKLTKSVIDDLTTPTKEVVLYEETSVKRYFIAKPLFLFSQPT